jgi:hypothetical protein
MMKIDDVPHSSPVSEKLNEIRTASLRAKGVVIQLLSFSRKSDTSSDTSKEQQFFSLQSGRAFANYANFPWWV